MKNSFLQTIISHNFGHCKSLHERLFKEGKHFSLGSNKYCIFQRMQSSNSTIPTVRGTATLDGVDDAWLTTQLLQKVVARRTYKACRDKCKEVFMIKINLLLMTNSFVSGVALSLENYVL